MPPVQLDYTQSVTIETISPNSRTYHDEMPTVQENPEPYLAEDERLDWFGYLMNAEYDSGYYHGFYLDEPQIELFEDLPERPITKAEIEDLQIKQANDDKRRIAVEQALLKAGKDYLYVVPLMTPEQKVKHKDLIDRAGGRKPLVERQQTFDEIFGAG